MIDTHAHLQAFDDVGGVLTRARDAGVLQVLVPGDTIGSSRRAIELSSQFEGVFPAVGIHPHDAKSLNEDALQELRRLALSGGVVAIGEIGLDYHYNFSPREVQRVAFAAQLDLAKELRLPVIIHDREAHDEIVEIVRASGHSSGVFHCFSGDTALASEALSMGFYISIAGPVTFKNATIIADVAKFVPRDRLLLETDSPYLTPHPFRGKRNEPAYLPYILNHVAELRGEDPVNLVESIRGNSSQVFGI